jgi:hypothetical protein
MSSVGLALAGTVPCVVGCCYQWMLVSSLVNALVCGVLSCCRCLCFRSSSLCPPLGIELHVDTIIHTVPTASTYNTKVRFPNCIVQRVFFSRARRPYNFFSKNNMVTSIDECILLIAFHLFFLIFEQYHLIYVDTLRGASFIRGCR